MRRLGRVARPAGGAWFACGMSALAVAVSGCTAGEPSGTAAVARADGGESAAGATADGAGPPPGAQEVTVARIVDGDTMVVDGSGGLVTARGTSVRLLLIDTPEVDGPYTEPECFGPQASDHLSDVAPPGSSLFLTADVEPEDRYGRVLAYAWTADGALLNEEIVRNGYARSVVYEPNDALVDRIRDAEDEARRLDRGLWGACG